jgi:hypothetical protein
MTQFEQAVQAANEGTLKTPIVNSGGYMVDYFLYQLSTHHHALKVLSIGVKMKGVKFSQIKEYYGLKARSAKDAVAEFESVIEAYKANR